MKQYEWIKKNIWEISNSFMMAGFLDGINESAIIFCKKNIPKEVYVTESGEIKVTIYGMAMYLDSEIDI